MCSMRGKVAVKDFRIERWPMGDLHRGKGKCGRTARSISRRVRLGPAAENRKKKLTTPD